MSGFLIAVWLFLALTSAGFCFHFCLSLWCFQKHVLWQANIYGNWLDQKYVLEEKSSLVTLCKSPLYRNSSWIELSIPRLVRTFSIISCPGEYFIHSRHIHFGCMFLLWPFSDTVFCYIRNSERKKVWSGTFFFFCFLKFFKLWKYDNTFVIDLDNIEQGYL